MTAQGKTAVAEVRATIEHLIESGSTFNIDALERIYHTDLKIVKIDERGAVTALDRAENMAFFRAKRDRGAEPLSKAATFNHVEARGDRGHVIVTRHVQFDTRPEKSIFSIHLIREEGRWQVLHETAFVQPAEDRT